MLLRSITRHVQAQNWTAVGIDFIIVVIGVYIGIQVSNWNEARVDARKGEYFSERLLGDIQFELQQYEDVFAYFSTVQDYARRAVVLIDSDNPALDNEFVVAAYNATQYNSTESIRSTYDELLATGNLYLLEDDNLRNTALFLYGSQNRERLSNYVLESAYRENVRQTMPYDVQEAIRSQCGDVIDPVTGFTSGIPADCRIDFPAERIGVAASLLRQDPDVRGDLAYFLSSLGYFISDVDAARDQAVRRLEGVYFDQLRSSRPPQ